MLFRSHTRLKVANRQSLYVSHIRYGQLYEYKGKIGQHDSSIADSEFKGSALLITGIAHAEPLEDELRRHFRVEALHFPDHHDYSERDYQCIRTKYELMQKDSPCVLVTTEKDVAKLDEKQLPEKSTLLVMPIETVLMNHQAEQFNQQIINYVRQNQRNSSIPS